MINSFFNSVAKIEYEQDEQNAMGGMKKTWITRIAALPCRVSSARIGEADEFGKMTMRGGWKLYCDCNEETLEITESDKVIVGSRTFQVKGIFEPGLLGRHLEIELLEIH